MSNRTRTSPRWTARACLGALAAFIALFANRSAAGQVVAKPTDPAVDLAQVAEWSADDLQFFLHGSMSTEVLPERVLKAFRAVYPELLPDEKLLFSGLLSVAGGDLPIGLSRRPVAHLGGLNSLGINCASCHVAQMEPSAGGATVRILGAPGMFDVETLFGAVAVATWQSSAPENMRRLLPAYLEACEPGVSIAARDALAARIRQQGPAIDAAIAEFAQQERSAPPGRLLDLDPAALTLDSKYLETQPDLRPAVRSLLGLFHNMRAALHLPHEPPKQSPPRSGPGRNDAFGILSLALFGEPLPYGPAKFGIVWNLAGRSWVHWDGNTRAPIIRNLAASLGLGAPLVENRGMLDFALVERHTRLSEQIRAPKFPWKIDSGLAQRGRRHFEQHCASCHAAAPGQREERLFDVAEVKTDANRAKMFDAHQAENYNAFFAKLRTPGYEPAKQPPVRSTHKYVAVSMAGVWARSPYLHNGSVRTMRELLTPAGQRAKAFHRGTRRFDTDDLGYVDDGPYLLDTASEGNSNAGHEYGVDLDEQQKFELIEYLKTL